MIKSGSLLLSMLANLNAKEMNRGMIGYSIEDTMPPIDGEDLKYYSIAIGEKYNYGSPGTPFFLSKLMYPLYKHFLTLKGLNLNLLKLVHGTQQAEWKRGLKPGEEIKVSMTIKDIYNTPAGEMLELLGRGWSGDEEIGSSATGFIVRSPLKKNIYHSYASGAQEKGKELFRTDFQTWEGQQIEYAVISGDNNFIHTSNLLAKLAGLPRTILQGVCVLAMTYSSILKEIGKSDYPGALQISARFASVVIPGQKITVIGYESDKSDEIIYEAVNISGKTVIKNGIFRLK